MNKNIFLKNRYQELTKQINILEKQLNELTEVWDIIDDNSASSSDTDNISLSDSNSDSDSNNIGIGIGGSGNYKKHLLLVLKETLYKEFPEGEPTTIKMLVNIYRKLYIENIILCLICIIIKILKKI